MDTAFELGNFWATLAALTYATLGVLLIAFLVHNSRVKTNLRQRGQLER